MAALGKIRSRGAILVGVISLALLAFIAEEGFRSCDGIRNNQRQQVGEVLGEKISVQEFQKLVDEYSEVIKLQQGTENLNDAQLTQVKDMVWNTYVQTKILEAEAKKIGLTVTDDEMQNILAQGTNQILLQTPFVNQQTGRFDVNALKNFLAEYKKQQSSDSQLAAQYQTLYKFWTFIEKTLRQQVLSQKYQTLLAHCFLSNPIEAKMAFNDENQESNIELASLPYSSIEDSKIQVSESDLKSKYDELKSLFRQPVETRNIKYVDVLVEPSATDRAELSKVFADYVKELSTSDKLSDIVRKSSSLVPYLGLPVAKGAFTTDISNRLDSIAVGSVYGPVENKQDNTLNIIKLVSKVQLPDSVEYRQIQVGGATVEAARKTADSIVVALNGGADFETIAKKYGQTGAKAWMTTVQYQSSPSMDADTKTYINTLNTASVGSINNISLPQGNIVVQILDKKNYITKYDVAVIKKTIDFSKETYRAAYNKFSSFVSANQTVDAIIKNAEKSGYRVLEANDVSTSQHHVAGINGTRDALKWIFETKAGSVSPMYEVGDNNHLLLVILDKVHKAGYRDLSDNSVKEYVKSEVIKDKKAEQLISKLQGVKNIAEAKSKGANITEVSQVTFASPVFITATSSSEPALSGAVSSVKQGAFSQKPVKGNAGVYLFTVKSKVARPVAFNAKEQEQKLSQRALQYASNFMNELYLNAGVVDNRYLFF